MRFQPNGSSNGLNCWEWHCWHFAEASTGIQSPCSPCSPPPRTVSRWPQQCVSHLLHTWICLAIGSALEELLNKKTTKTFSIDYKWVEAKEKLKIWTASRSIWALLRAEFSTLLAKVREVERHCRWWRFAHLTPAQFEFYQRLHNERLIARWCGATGVKSCRWPPDSKRRVRSAAGGETSTLQHTGPCLWKHQSYSLDLFIGDLISMRELMLIWINSNTNSLWFKRFFFFSPVTGFHYPCESNILMLTETKK